MLAMLTNAGNDPDRMARRAEIKKELAGLKATEKLADALRHQMRQLAAREATARDSYDAATAKANAVLAEIEKETTDLILSDAEIPEKIVKQRDAALTKLTTAKSKLDAEIEPIKILRLQLQERLSSLANEVGKIPRVRGKLTVFGVANPELLTQRFVINSRSVWAQNRHRAAQRDYQAACECLDSMKLHREKRQQKNSFGDYVAIVPGEDEISQRREVYNLLAELEAAADEVAAATEAKNRIVQQIVEE